MYNKKTAVESLYNYYKTNKINLKVTYPVPSKTFKNY